MPVLGFNANLVGSDFPPELPMPLIAAKVDETTKSAFADLARRHGLSESDLMRRAVSQLLGNTLPSPAPPVAERRQGRQVKLRLWADELESVERLAVAEARSVPAWIAALVRRTALDAVPFSPAELDALHRAIAALGPLGRNLNTLVKHWHQTGRIDVEAVGAKAVATAVSELRTQVVELADRASNRYSPTDMTQSRPSRTQEGIHES